MALALADSLLASGDLDPADLMRRFVAWREKGECSCTGSCSGKDWLVYCVKEGKAQLFPED